VPKEKYLVTGTRKFKGVLPGQVLEAELSEEQEARAIARGSISKDTSDKSLESMTREELDELAAAAGIEDPEELGTKQDVIKAIRDNK
jgi:hypothetical protein